ncbi:MAG: Rrf2 family protein [Candidatus Omnitrophota bacterium]|jgi:Rrf2 family protein
MNISAKTDYACRALLALCLHWPNEKPIQMNDIATRHKIPLKFLTQILIQLKATGLVQSIRGKNGGYVLVKKPIDITLYDILVVFEANTLAINNDRDCGNALNEIWTDINDTMENKLKEYNFEKILQKHNSQNDVVMFQI